MKGFIVKTLIVGSLSLLAFSTSFADDAKMAPKMASKNMKWMCETNASSSQNANDQKADQEMKNKAMSARDAFGYAYKHCRDCTKISCSMESGSSSQGQ